MKPHWFGRSVNEILGSMRLLDKLFPNDKFYFVDRGAKHKPVHNRYRIYKRKPTDNETN